MKIKKVIIYFLLVIWSFFIAGNCAAQDNYSAKEKELLLNLARETLYWYLKDKNMPTVPDQYLTPNLLEKKACFVTLDKKSVGLRGCIGMFPPVDTPLYKNVINRSIAAAVEDSRFSPVKYDELKDIKVEISILSTPKELQFTSPEDLLDKLKPFEDGVIITTEYGASTCLPQVWEQIIDKKEFLSSLCRKHGATSDYWKTNYKNMKVEIYSAVYFSEENYGRKIIGKNGGSMLFLVETPGFSQNIYPLKSFVLNDLNSPQL